MFSVVTLVLLQILSPARTVGKGPTSGIDTPRQVAVRSTGDWTALWREHGLDSHPPAVDFSREMVVGVFLGTQPTAGYGVEIVRTIGANGGLIVEYVETRPGRGAITAQVLTAPYHLIAMPIVTGEVRFARVDK